MNDQGFQNVICKKRLLNRATLIQQEKMNEVVCSAFKFINSAAERKKKKILFPHRSTELI